MSAFDEPEPTQFTRVDRQSTSQLPTTIKMEVTVIHKLGWWEVVAVIWVMYMVAVWWMK